MTSFVQVFMLLRLPPMALSAMQIRSSYPPATVLLKGGATDLMGGGRQDFYFYRHVDSVHWLLFQVNSLHSSLLSHRITMLASSSCCPTLLSCAILNITISDYSSSPLGLELEQAEIELSCGTYLITLTCACDMSRCMMVNYRNTASI